MTENFLQSKACTRTFDFPGSNRQLRAPGADEGFLMCSLPELTEDGDAHIGWSFQRTARRQPTRCRSKSPGLEGFLNCALPLTESSDDDENSKLADEARTRVSQSPAAIATKCGVIDRGVGTDFPPTGSATTLVHVATQTGPDILLAESNNSRRAETPSERETVDSPSPPPQPDPPPHEQHEKAANTVEKAPDTSLPEASAALADQEPRENRNLIVETFPLVVCLNYKLRALRARMLRAV
ncbi:hypothetical protein BDZ88DRAFT_415722 [Geranomyces variabilis]|nr:hypothetical protein BDZ88DRAFT_415722 [Geranomyces variabilis]KAJ3141294.1 hypothetical protein HDU90_007321 [Geranomyces variabilis]